MKKLSKMATSKMRKQSKKITKNMAMKSVKEKTTKNSTVNNTQSIHPRREFLGYAIISLSFWIGTIYLAIVTILGI